MNKLLIVYRKYWNGPTVLSALASFSKASSTPAEFLLSFLIALKALFARAAILFSNQLPSTFAALSFHRLIFVVKYRVVLFFFFILGVGRGERTTLMYFPQFSPNLGAEKWQDQCYPPTIQHCTRPAPEPRALKQPVCWRSGKTPGKHPVWGTVPIGNHRCVRIRVLSMCSGSGVSVFLTKRATVEQVMLMWSGNKFLLGFLNWVFASCLFYGFLFYALYL